MKKIKSISIDSIDEVIKYRNKILENMEICKIMLAEMIALQDALTFFKNIKYDKVVIDPLTEEAENLIEVVNQNQTYLVSLKGVEYLIEVFPNVPFRINFGNIPGHDIESEDGSIIAECFASTSYKSNSKLLNDLKKLSKNESAKHKFTFFYDKEFSDTNREHYESKYPDIRIFHFEDVI